jgi:hypothetical protein
MLHSDPLALDIDPKALASARALARQKQLLGLLRHSSFLRQKLVKSKKAGRLSWPDYQKKDRRLVRIVDQLKARLGLQN